MRKHGRIKAVLKKAGDVLVKGAVAGVVKWLLDWLANIVS